MSISVKPAARVLPNLKQATPALPYEELLRLVKAQQEQIDAMAAARQRTIGFKVSEKGCVTITGTGQFGTTLYASQWATILDHAPALAAFIRDNLPRLAVKPGQETAIRKAIATYLD